MVQVNFARKEVNCKIVYYGPGLSGKTTNIEVIYEKAPKENRGELTSIATEGDRTLFFDFMPLELGNVAGMNTKFQLYTVPGQVYYNSTRKLVLQGADGIVFVADSQVNKLEENLESLQNLEENLREYGMDIATMPIVLQYNKRDLPNIMSVEFMNEKLNKWSHPYYEATAFQGIGVFQTLKVLAGMVLDSINKGDRRSASPQRPTQSPPPGYGAPPPPQGYGAPPPGYGAPPPQGYGAPPQGYGAPPQGYGAPPPQGYGAPPPGYGAPPPQGYGAPPPQGYGAPPGYGVPPGQRPGGPGNYGVPPQQNHGRPGGYAVPPPGLRPYNSVPPGGMPPRPGTYPPQPNQGGGYPQPNQGGGYPQPNQGGGYPPPNYGGGYPPPNYGGGYPQPQQQKPGGMGRPPELSTAGPAPRPPYPPRGVAPPPGAPKPGAPKPQPPYYPSDKDKK